MAYHTKYLYTKNYLKIYMKKKILPTDSIYLVLFSLEMHSSLIQIAETLQVLLFCLERNISP